MRVRWTCRALSLVLVALVLSACRGGGGGGDGGVGDAGCVGVGDAGQTPPSLSVSPGSLRFEGEEKGSTPAAQSLTVLITAPGEAMPHVNVAASSHGLSEVSYDTSTNPFTVRVTPKAPADVGVGTVTDQLVISACLDAACTHPIAGSPTTVDVTYTVRSHLQVLPEALSFNYVLGSSPPPSGATLALQGTSVHWKASASPGWLQLSGATSGTAPASLGVVLNTLDLAAGIHTGTITLTDTDSGESVAVPVTLQATAPTLTVGPGPLSFSSADGVASPAQPLVLGLDTGSAAYGWTATVSTGSGPQWLKLSSTAGTVSASPTTLTASVDPTGLSSGAYAATVTFTASVAGQAVSQTVPVSLSVHNPLVVAPEALSFSYVLGSSLLPDRVALSLQGASEHWKASASPGWLQLSGATSGTTPASLSVGVDTTGLSVGTHDGSITLTDTDTGERTTVPVTLRVAAASLTAAPGALSFSSSDVESPPAQSLVLGLDTGTTAYGWTAALDTGSVPSWLKLSSTSGTVSASGTTLTVTVDSTGLQGGTYSASLVFTASVAGQTVSRTVPVSLSIHGYLWVADNGVGLVSTPSLSKLSHTVTVKDSLGQSTGSWVASSSQGWLSVTPSGSGGGDLTLSANPEGLAADTVHYAEVSIAPSDSPTQVSEVIKVGLWVGAASPKSQDTLSLAYKVVETDPIRPYAYVHNGAGDLSVYNLHTAGLVTTLKGLGSSLGAMTVSNDGSTLYVLDATTLRIVPVDLGTLTAGTPWTLSSGQLSWLTYTRPNGHGFVLTNDGQIFEPTTGKPVAVTGRLPSGAAALSASLDGSLFCGIDTGYSPYSMSCYALQYTRRTGAVTVTLRGSGPFGVGSNGRDVAINHDGTRVYAASGAPYSFTVYDGQTLKVLTQLTADAYPNAVEVGPDNRLYGAASVWYGPKDVWVYDNAGWALGSYYESGYARSILDRQLKVSGDGKRFVVLTDDPSLRFVTAP